MPGYQWNAEDYEKNSSQQQVWARELICKLQLRGNEHVLDIGCGDGKVTTEISAALPEGRVLGVDNSSGMVDLARQRFPGQDFPNLYFQLEDACSLRFKDEFDVVFSNACLHWIKDHQSVLNGISQALKPCGKALLQMGGQGNAAGIISALGILITKPEWVKYFQDFQFPFGFYGIEEYRDWLGLSGLSPIRVELIPKDMVHADVENLKGWIRTTWLPYTQRIPITERDRFISDLAETYLIENPTDSQGRVHVRMVRLEVEASKAGG
jgi:trans-aconitate methyltransferase